LIDFPEEALVKINSSLDPQVQSEGPKQVEDIGGPTLKLKLKVTVTEPEILF
jgi:hypothetical protein